MSPAVVFLHVFHAVLLAPPAGPPPGDAADAPPADPIAAARAELEAMNAEIDAEYPAGSEPGPARMATGDAIAWFERRVGGDPRDARNRTVLGRLLMRKAKEDDDHAAAARAVEVLRAAVAADSDYTPARTQLAVAVAANHGFAESLELARGAYAADPRDTLALATVGDALLELGRVDEAAASFADLETAAGRVPPVLARLARAAELRGETDEAAALIDAALAAAEDGGAPADRLAWYAWRRGSLAFAAGDLNAAERFYNRALGAAPDDAAARAGLAEVAAARGNLDAAADLYRELVESHGEPPMVAALGDVRAAAGDLAAAEQLWDKAEAGMAEEAKVAETAHLREVARFLADHGRDPARAVELAKRDLEIRQDAAAYDTLAHALLEDGKLREAAAAADRALAAGGRPAEAVYHAGVIAAARGESAEAADLLAEALSRNPHFHVLKAPHARLLLDGLRGRPRGEGEPAGAAGR